MNADELLDHFSRNAVTLKIVDDTIRFKAPQGFMTQELLGDLKANKQEILSILRGSDASIPRRSAHGPCVASFGQQRLWVLDQIEPGNTFYNQFSAVRLLGNLDANALEDAFNEVMRRHEILRTAFDTVDGVPVQVIAPELTLALPVTDLSALTPDDCATQVKRLIGATVHTPFDLATGPLIRARLFRLENAEHIVLLVMHHIVSDGWSVGVLVREIAALYAAFARKQSSPLIDLPIQYADFAQWQRKQLQGDVLDRQLRYWTQQLGGAPAMLTLPTDRPRPPLQTYRGAALNFSIPATTTAGLHVIGKRAKATLFMTLTAAFNVLLSRYSGQSDICIGTPIANRNRAELEPLIGFFVNTLVLRTQVDGSLPFTDLLQQVRTNALGAYAHQDVPFEQLVDALKPERQMSHAPLFQVMLVLQNTPVGSIELHGLTLQPVVTESAIAKFDLTLNVTEQGDHLSAHIDYSTDLFDASTIGRMADHFINLLQSIAVTPDARIADLPMLSEAERTRMLVEWNDTATDYPDLQTLHQQFEAQVDRTPDAIAVVFENEQLTYAELNVRANQQAHLLRVLGVGPDVLVALCFERSVEMIVGIMAVLKAGGAYVPLDPANPGDRLATILADAQPAALLTVDWIRARLPAGVVLPMLCLDDEWDTLAPLGDYNPVNRTLPANLAYVIYTSGSTGKPKGVTITHRSLINFSRILQQNFYHGDKVNLTSNAPYVFDMSLKHISMISAGHTLHVLSDEVRLAPAEMLSYIQKNNVAGLECTPSQLKGLTEHMAAPGIKSGLPKNVLLGGEPIDQSRWDELREFTGTQFINMYGPTEATIDSAMCLLRDFDAPTMGKAIANTQLYILDAWLNPVPVGVAGELHIAGDGLARGYLKQPSLTAEKFIPNPFGAPGSRMYRSGDLARYRPNGNIEYLGRIDNQVKIRGFRIELGEIESALAALPDVRDVVVLAREDVAGDKRLVAYVVGDEAELDVTELRTALAASLPDYMVPAHFMMLAQLPLTSNGKVDRKALPAPDMTRSEAGYVAPRTATEGTMAALWADVLHLDRVGVHDNFFALGGHSLLATQVISKLRAAFQTEMPLRALFESPTVAALSLLIDQQCQSGTNLPRIVAVERGAAIPLSFAQQRLWFLDQFEPGSAFYNMPVALRLTGRLDVAALTRAFDDITRRHETLRTTFALVDGSPVQVIAPFAPAALRLTDLGGLPLAEREARMQQLAQDEARAPFDLTAGPLIRASLIRLGETEHVALLTMHHIVSDGWSMGVVVKEVAALYGAHVQNRPSPLPELAIQYADFAHWQRQWLSGDVLAQQLDYWRTRLACAPTLLSLPTDRPRPPSRTYCGATLNFTIPAATTAGLHVIGKQAKATLFMTLAAAFNVLLSRYSGQSDICIGTAIANRNRVEIEPLIGFFINTLVLRTEVDGSLPFSDLLQQVRTNALGAYAHQDVPFEQVVDALKPERQMSHAPLFQVMMVLQNTPMSSLELPGLTLQPVETESAIAKFDLALNVIEQGDHLSAHFEYNTDLFDGSTIARMTDHFMNLLQSIAVTPELRIADLPMLSEAERTRMLVEWNDKATDYPNTQTIHQLFEAQVDRTPDAIAVVFEEHQLTYAALNARANQLAHHLRALGVGPDVLVALCVERSVEMIVGMLGILKAGGAYLPLDPAYPKDRLAYMVADAKPAVLLTQHALPGIVPVNDIPVICLDTHWTSLVTDATHNLVNITLPSHLAYVIYTSGSTGRPKGVLLKHDGLCNLVHTQVGVIGIQPNHRFLQFASFNFDASTWEIFMTLAAGATLCMATREDLMPGGGLEETLRRHAVNIVSVPPVALGILSPTRLPHLKIVIAAGEACSQMLVDQWARDHVFFNGYGPTEVTVCASIHRCRVAEAEIPPIGQPMANKQIYILDRELNPVPIGVAGELHIAGVGLARGYLNRPDLTADKFIPNPFGVPGSRMYKSGDLARYLADGNIEFMGRIDQQVKIRGLRIELGEIESALAALPGVRDVVVLAREDIAGDKRLVAYVIAQDGIELSVDDLRASLSAELPDYMVPNAFVSLPAFPLSPNGKIDRRALPAPDRNAVGARTYEAPHGDAEVAIAQIWQDLLGVGQVGRHDNFFDLGGHSLLAVQLVSRLKSMLGIDVSVRKLFAQPTLQAFAAAATDNHPASNFPNLIPVRPAGSLLPLFLIHPVAGNVDFARAIASCIDRQLPVYGIAAHGLEDGETPLKTIEAMASQYIDAIRSVQPHGPYHVAGYSAGGTIAYEIAHQLICIDERVAFLGMIDTVRCYRNRHAALSSRRIDRQQPAGRLEADILLSYLLDKYQDSDQSLAQDLLVELKSLVACGDFEAMIALCKKASLLPSEISSATVRRYIAVFEATQQALFVYDPQPVSASISLFTAAHVPIGESRLDTSLGWSALSSNRLHVTHIGGTHHTIVKPPHVQVLADAMANILLMKTSEKDVQILEVDCS